MTGGFAEGDERNEELSEALRREMIFVQPNVQELVGGGVTRGRRRVRRRRIAQIAAAGATFAVLGGVAYAVPWNARPTAELGVASGGPGAAADAPAAATKMVGITPQATVQLLIDQLPAGAKTGKYSGGWNGRFKVTGGKADPNDLERTGTYAQLAYFDRTGASLMGLEVQWSQVDRSWFDCPAPAEGATCERGTLPDGSILVVDQDHEYPAGERYGEGKGPRVWSATILRKDGLRVQLWENNASVEKGPESRANPPLTMTQLEAIVTSPVWQAKVDAETVRRAAHLFEPVSPKGDGYIYRSGSPDAVLPGALKRVKGKTAINDKARLEGGAGSTGAKVEQRKVDAKAEQEKADQDRKLAILKQQQSGASYSDSSSGEGK